MTTTAEKKRTARTFDPATYRPANHYILVRHLPRETKAGIILPPSSGKTSPRVDKWQGEVISISPGCDLKDAALEDLKPGDVVDSLAVMTASWSEEYNGDMYILLCDGDICGRRE